VGAQRIRNARLNQLGWRISGRRLEHRSRGNRMELRVRTRVVRALLRRDVAWAAARAKQTWEEPAQAAAMRRSTRSETSRIAISLIAASLIAVSHGRARWHAWRKTAIVAVAARQHRGIAATRQHSGSSDDCEMENPRLHEMPVSLVPSEYFASNLSSLSCIRRESLGQISTNCLC
jgi:hypothetical protein